MIAVIKRDTYEIDSNIGRATYEHKSKDQGDDCTQQGKSKIANDCRKEG